MLVDASVVSKRQEASDVVAICCSDRVCSYSAKFCAEGAAIGCVDVIVERVKGLDFVASQFHGCCHVRQGLRVDEGVVPAGVPHSKFEGQRVHTRVILAAAATVHGADKQVVGLHPYEVGWRRCYRKSVAVHNPDRRINWKSSIHVQQRVRETSTVLA